MQIILQILRKCKEKNVVMFAGTQKQLIVLIYYYHAILNKPAWVMEEFIALIIGMLTYLQVQIRTNESVGEF